ncbi:histidinol-phosphatase [uncultured Fretibacterium sp.]|uniref:histidinol-phosphatase n=1 Tax=uncultured Fretibacterium sp. TaxID=1678694 RepID=UPI00325FCAAF
MIRSTLHNHTTLCDGRSSPEEMVLAAVAAGLTDLGFSAHSPAPFDAGSLRSEAEYRRTILGLRERYAGTIRIVLGMEQDYLAPVARRSDYDFLIGSVHFLKVGGECLSVDWDEERFAALLAAGGGPESAIRAYYASVADMVRTQRPNVVGHFDLIGKFNADERFFREDEAYRRAALEALDVVIGSECVPELNASGFRWRGRPYPDGFLLRRLREKNRLLTLQADCHDAQALLRFIPEAAEVLRHFGFRSTLQWIDGAWQEVGL